MSSTATRTYRATEVCRATGVTYRQLCHWCNIGLFGEDRRNLGSGRLRRPFDQAELEAVGVVAQLMALTVPSSMTVRDQLPEIIERVRTGELGQVEITRGITADLTILAGRAAAQVTP